jgi:lysophospholipase L1-like esterase
MNPAFPEPGDVVSPDPRSSARRARPRLVLGFVSLAAVLGVTLGAVAVRGSTPADEATIASGDDVVVEATSIDTDLLPFTEAWTRIDDPSREFVVVVLGDSTGNEQGEWVDRAFRMLAEELDRPLIEHPWNVQSARYADPVTVNSAADGAPIIVWNGSASGKTAAYSLDNYDRLVPQQPDVLFLNHGLNNVRRPDGVGAEFSDVLTRTEQNWPRSVGYAALLENPRFDDWATAHDAVLDGVRSWLAERPFVLGIDVHDAYLAREDVATLLTVDLLHPSPAGSQLTAETVLAAIASVVVPSAEPTGDAEDRAITDAAGDETADDDAVPAATDTAD